MGQARLRVYLDAAVGHGYLDGIGIYAAQCNGVVVGEVVHGAELNVEAVARMVDGKDVD